MVAMATYFKRSEKQGQIFHLRSNVHHLVKSVKISPVNPEIIDLQAIIKKKEISQAKHTARLARMPSGLNSLLTK